jgi:hypothetical protein
LLPADPAARGTTVAVAGAQEQAPQQQDPQDWSEAEAVLVAAATAVEEGAAEGELQTPELAESCLAPPPGIHRSVNGSTVSFPPWVLEEATFAEVASRLGGGGEGAWDWLSVLANSFALNAINGLSPNESAATPQRDSAGSRHHSRFPPSGPGDPVPSPRS